ncbi:MAG: hypothetical protein AB9842_06235 [Bacteroidales bacterium]
MAGFSQEKSKDIIALEKKADKIFRLQQYSQAKDLYSTLLSNYPKDPFYSYRFGVCLLYGDRRNMEKPVQYLELASKSTDIDKEVFYYLGQAYHFNYRFTDAIRLYQKYRGLVSENKAAKKDVDRQIEMCQNGLYLLSRVKDLFVIERKEVKKADFYRNYNLSGFGGEILQQPPFFKSKLDIKKGVSGLVFFPRKQDIVLYSSYGKDGQNGKDIYYSTLLPDMTWSKPVRLPGAVNTPFDEDYPFLLPDGRTLYFASKGHNSMGGYDIFKSVLDTITGEWKQPENLDFAINTPFDDQLFVTDPFQHYAYFSSNRTSVEDNIMVYMVRVDKRPDKIQEINLDIPLAGTEGDEKVKRSVAIIKQMADLAVNAGEDNYQDSIVAYAVAEVIKTETRQVDAQEPPKFENTLNDRIRQKEALQHTVDTAFEIAAKMEEAVKKIDKTVENIQSISYLTTDRKQKDMADKLAVSLGKESKKKQGKLAQVQMLAAGIQQYAATGKPDSAIVFYQMLKDKIAVSDTAEDYQDLVLNTLAGKPVITKNKVKDDFLTDAKPLKTSEERERLDEILILANNLTNEVTFETKIITPKEEEQEPEPEPVVVAASSKPEPAEKEGNIQIHEELPAIVRNPELANKVLNTIIAQKDTLKQLQIKAQRQKLLLLAGALDKSNAAGSKYTEVKKLEGVLETVITEGSARDLKVEIRKLRNESANLAEEAVLSYTLATKLDEREKMIENALREVESQAINIEKTIDSGKAEKAGILLDLLVEPIRNFVAHSHNDDDIIAATHRNARELKISILSNYKQARQLAISSKASLDMSANLKRQAESHMDKTVSKNLLDEAKVMDKQAVDRQKEALEIFNQNIIWQNRSIALESSLPRSRRILESIAEKVNQAQFKPPKKRFKDTTLLIPVMLDLLSDMLPVNDTSYEKLAKYEIVKNQPLAVLNEEILKRTEFAANVDDNLIKTQQQNIQKRTDKLVFQKLDPRELELREKLARLNDSVDNKALKTPVKTSADVASSSQWELDKPSFLLLKKQVDTLYNKVKRQPQLKLPSTLKGLFEELSMLTDSMSESFSRYRKAKINAVARQDTARIAMTLELDAFEVKATSNRLKYLINRLYLSELALSSSNPEINSKPQPDSLIAVEYFHAADQKRETAAQTRDRKQATQLLNQADELEKKGIQEQMKLAENLKEAPQEAVIAVVPPKEITVRPSVQEKQPFAQTLQEKEQKQEIVKLQPEITAVPVKTAEIQSKQRAEKKIEPDKKPDEVKSPEVPKPKPGEEKPELKIDNARAEKQMQEKEKPAAEPKGIPEQTKSLPAQASARSFVSQYVEKPLSRLTSSEIETLEYEISSASQRMQLPMLPGLMYSVQVGVYKTSRSSNQLFNINPLFEDLMNNGNYRYFSGIFGNRNDAVDYKNLMIQKGVADAFVVVFYKGRKITAAEAALLTGESITTVIRQNKLDQLSKQKSGLGSKVYFSVQLAAYRRPLTPKEMEFYSGKINTEIITSVTEGGLTVIVTGEFSDYNTSLEARKNIIAQGVSDAFIVGFVDGKRVMAYQARAALNTAP